VPHAASHRRPDLRVEKAGLGLYYALVVLVEGAKSAGVPRRRRQVIRS
jgi:hypothetical protein